MTNKKLTFIIISAIILLLVMFLALKLSSKGNNNTKIKSTAGDFKIWILGDDKDKFNVFLDSFKVMNKKYSKNIFTIESFKNYDEYEKVLASAIAKGQAPDVFVLNNNTSSFADDQVSGIDPKIINPNDFRKKYKGVFSDDLVISSKDKKSGKDIEFLKGLPIGYETLGIYYNRKYVKATDLSSLAGLKNVVSKIKSIRPSLIPIGMGNGTTVLGSQDIITQLFMLEDGKSLSSISSDKVKSAFGSYLAYGNISGNNSYDSTFVNLKQDNKNNFDLFTDSSVVMVVGYPRDLGKIDKNGYSKVLLQAVPFPHYYSGSSKTILNYNYFVINKDTSKYPLANDLLKYMYQDNGASKYLDQFTYYLPALLSLESDKFDSKVSPSYNIVLKDFLDNNSELSSFDKGLKGVYDREIRKILDDSSNYNLLFENMKNSILCEKDKIINLKNLSKSCK